MSISGNALVIKEMNINLVRRTLKTQRQATKHQIAEVTGLSTVTIGTILQRLIEDNVVFEVGLVASMGGRPAQQYRFNENHAHVLALFTHEQDGLDMLHVRVANLYGVCLYEVNAPLTDINLHSFEPFIDDAIKAYPTIRAIGFGLPGIEQHGTVILADYPGLVGTPLIEHYQQRYQLPAIFENDVNAASVGYCITAGIDSEAAMIYLYFPQKYPPGGGITINSRLYKGASGFAGEVAALPLGVDWRDPDLYHDPDRIGDIIFRMITAAVSLLNPHSVVLCGKFLTPEHLDRLQRQCADSLPPSAIPALRIADDFTLDYQTGVIEETLAVLDPQTSISL